MTDSYVGQKVAGQFRILQRIGTGGMGAVYKAEQPDMNRFVAIKILHPKFLTRPDLVSRFRREARAMSHLSHPNTARVFLYGQLDDGACYFVMEYLEGRNLAQVVRQEGAMDPERAIAVMVQVCGALEEAHQMGIVHRDLKPENIFLTTQGGIADYPKVLDFGLAKVTERQMQPGSVILTQQGMVFGTPEFMSPEQARGETLDSRTDIYALGIILYELVTGKLPFDATKPIDFINKHIHELPLPFVARAPDKQFPAGLQEAVSRALEKERGRRFASAAEFGQALRDVVRGKLIRDAVRALPVVPTSGDALGRSIPGMQGTPASAAASPDALSAGPSAVSPLRPLGHGQASRPQDSPRSEMPAKQSLPAAAWVVFAVAVLLALGSFAALVAVWVSR